MLELSPYVGVFFWPDGAIKTRVFAQNEAEEQLVLPLAKKALEFIQDTTVGQHEQE